MALLGVPGKRILMIATREIATRCLVHIYLVHRAVRLTDQLACLQCSQSRYPQNENEDSNALEYIFPILRI